MEQTTGQTIPNIIQKELGQIEETRKRILSMAPLVVIAEELIAKFKDLPGTSDWSISLGYGIGSLQGVLLSTRALDFRELTEVRRWLRQRGFPVPKTSDYAELNRHSWTYDRKDEPSLVFSAFAGSLSGKKLEGQKCEYIQVGVKEEPVYELRCDGKKLTEDNGGEETSNQ